MENRATYRIVISKEERRKFKELAKSKGMTIQGYLVLLIRRELKENQTPDTAIPPQRQDGNASDGGGIGIGYRDDNTTHPFC